MFKSSDRYFYMQHRKEIDGVPYFITESSDGLGFEHTRQTVDIGQLVYNGEFENTFAENFRMYTTVFPMLKSWYQVEYNVDENNVDEYSRKIECEHLKDEIIDLNGTIEMLNSMMYRHRLSYDVVGKKIDGLISHLKEMNVTTKEGKDVIDSLLELAEGVREENQVDEPESNPECHVETKEDLVGLDIDELNVILKIKQNKVNGLKSLKGKYETANDNYKRVIGEIERKIEELKIAVVKENKEDNEINEVSL